MNYAIDWILNRRLSKHNGFLLLLIMVFGCTGEFENGSFTTLNNHFREDHSSYHVVDFDTLTGDVLIRQTFQGYSDESSWSRGQAWGLYGYTMVYRFTGEKLFLDQAEKIASFLLDHPNLPGDLAPYWDFDAPDIPDEPPGHLCGSCNGIGTLRTEPVFGSWCGIPDLRRSDPEEPGLTGLPLGAWREQRIPVGSFGRIPARECGGGCIANLCGLLLSGSC